MSNYLLGTGLLAAFGGITAVCAVKVEHVARGLHVTGAALRCLSVALLAGRDAYRTEAHRLAESEEGA